MRHTAIALAMLVVCGATAAMAKEPRKPMALIPFEIERAQERGDRVLLNFNEDITRVPSFRVLELPVVDGKLGEHARIDGNAEIYFPFGRVVTATAEFHKYRPALVASTAPTGVEVTLDPQYQRVAAFDRQLGKVCAVEIMAEGHEVEMRINPNRVMSVVHIMPARHVGPTAAENPSYKVTSGLEMRFLRIKEPMADQLYAACQRSKSQKLTQKN